MGNSNNAEIILSIVSIAIALISIALVFIGWRVVLSDARKLATRNETFALVKDLAGHIDKLRDEGVEMWLSKDAEKRIHQNAKINCEIKTIRNTIEKIKKNRKISLQKRDLIELRQAITLNYTPSVIADKDKLTAGLTEIFLVSNEFKWKAFSSFESQHNPLH